MPIILDGTTGITTPGITNTGEFVFQGPIQVPAGSAASASVTTAAGPDTGIYFPSSSSIAITTAGTERLVVDSAGNAGLGVTPSAWSGTAKAMQVVNVGIEGRTDNASYATLSANGYTDSGTWKYISSDFASRYTQFQGQHLWLTAASGTAGNNITFTQAMTLDASGNLGVGTTSPSYRLQVETPSATGNIVGYFRQGSGAVAAILSTTDLVGFGNGATAGETRIYADGGSGLVTFRTNSAERARITSNGQIITAYDDGRYAQRGIVILASNFDNPVQNIVTLPASGSTNVVISIKVTCNQNAYASVAANQHIGNARAMWDGSAWVKEVDTMTVVCGDIATVGTIAWSGSTLQYTTNRVSNYDGYLVTYEVLYNPVATTLTYAF